MPQLRLVFIVNGLSQLDQTKIGHVQQKKSHRSQIVFNHIKTIYI